MTTIQLEFAFFKKLNKLHLNTPNSCVTLQGGFHAKRKFHRSTNKICDPYFGIWVHHSASAMRAVHEENFKGLRQLLTLKSCLANVCTLKT
jgi:hypothetical protein